jgi:hypothetical protein
VLSALLHVGLLCSLWRARVVTLWKGFRG